MKYNYVIVEDQKGAFDNLKSALKRHSQYLFIGHATNISDAVTLIMQNHPDLIFLDVELGTECGFDLITDLKNAYFELPPIIMTTAHNSYAKSAVNNQITYFLTKPISNVELTKGLKVFEQKHASLHTQFFVRNGKCLEVVKYADIVYLEADGGYTKIFLNDGKLISVAKSLKHFETKLNEDFIRVHRGYIINVLKIKEIRLTERECVLESDTQCSKIEIGRNHMTLLRSKLKI